MARGNRTASSIPRVRPRPVRATTARPMQRDLRLLDRGDKQRGKRRARGTGETRCAAWQPHLTLLFSGAFFDRGDRGAEGAVAAHAGPAVAQGEEAAASWGEVRAERAE